MKRKICACFVIGLSLLSPACGGIADSKADIQNQEIIPKTTKVETIKIELTEENIYDYIDFVKVDENTYVVVSKQYENGSYFLKGDVTIHFVNKYESNKQGYLLDNPFCVISSFYDSTLDYKAPEVFSDEYEIDHIAGTIEFLSDANVYIENDTIRVIEYYNKYGQMLSQHDEISERAKYFDEYPY